VNGRHLPQRAGEQAGQGAARRLLLGLLLGGAFGLSEFDRAAGGIGHPHLDAKVLAVVGTALVGQQVPGLARATRPAGVLQRRLVVADRSGKGSDDCSTLIMSAAAGSMIWR